MRAVSNLADTTEFRLALIDSSSGMLLATSESDRFYLPRVSIPKWTRPAEEINDAVRREWQLSSLVLKLLPATDGRPTIAVAELISSLDAEAGIDLVLKELEELDDAELSAQESAVLYSTITEEPLPSSPFSRCGWLTEAQEWIQSRVVEHSVEFSKDFRQFNASENFALVRLGTKDNRSFWLKATGEPNTHECSLSVELAFLFPEFIPPVIATREDWNAWVTEDAGSPLGSTQDIDILTAAVAALADLQLLSLRHIARLEHAGCMNRTVGRLQAHLPEMISFLEEAMRNQTSTKVLPVAPLRLREIGSIVETACERILELDIPSALVNGDINLGNILFDGTSFRFTDWAEGGVGNPFFTLQQVIQHVIRDGEHVQWVPVLCSVYKDKWNAVLTERQIDGAFALMPLLTIVDYLYGRGEWLSSLRRNEPSFQSFARTLGRCMDRAAQDLISREVRRP